MISYSNTTTARLEAFARARGLDWRIVKTPDNTGGLWHAVGDEHGSWPHWYGLGWTVAEAKEALTRVAAEPSVDEDAAALDAYTMKAAGW